MGQVIVKPIKEHAWARMARYQKCHDGIVVNKNRQGYITGLSKKEAEQAENELALEAGTLGPYSDYWKDFVVTITDKPLRLNPDKSVKDFLDYKALLMSSRVCNSSSERAKWPKAEYIMIDAEEEAREENKGIDNEVDAMSTFSNLTMNEKKDYLKLFGQNPLEMSDSIVTNTLFKLAKDKSEKFNEITNMDFRKTKVLVWDLLAARVLTMKGGQVFYGDISLGRGQEEAVIFLEEAENQDLKISLKGELEK